MLFLPFVVLAYPPDVDHAGRSQQDTGHPETATDGQRALSEWEFERTDTGFHGRSTVVFFSLGQQMTASSFCPVDLFMAEVELELGRAFAGCRPAAPLQMERAGLTDQRVEAAQVTILAPQLDRDGLPETDR